MLTFEAQVETYIANAKTAINNTLNSLRAINAEAIQNAEYNQAKVLYALQKNRVDAACMQASTGYGYDDMGREKLERTYADIFHTESALVRPQIVCGTHALTVALSANLLFRPA